MWLRTARGGIVNTDNVAVIHPNAMDNPDRDVRAYFANDSDHVTLKECKGDKAAAEAFIENLLHKLNSPAEVELRQ